MTLAEVGVAEAQCLRKASTGNKGGCEHSSHNSACFLDWSDPRDARMSPTTTTPAPGLMHKPLQVRGPKSGTGVSSKGRTGQE